MSTVTVLLLYRKLIPLRCLPWCDNLTTLGCRRILFFLCFSKVKNRRAVCVFWVPGRSPWTKLAEIRRECCQNVGRRNRLRILIILFIKKLCLFFGGSPIFFPFLTLSSCKIIINACAKNSRHVFEVNVWRNRRHVNRFLRPKFSGRIPWFMGSCSFVNIFTFSKHGKFLTF